MNLEGEVPTSLILSDFFISINQIQFNYETEIKKIKTKRMERRITI